MRPDEVKPETWVVVGGRPARIPALPSIPLSSRPRPRVRRERIYSRNEATEGWEAFEAMLGGLEGGDAVAVSSGMAACAAVLGQLPTGAHLVLVDDCYQGVAAIAEAGARDPPVASRAAAGERRTMAGASARRRTYCGSSRRRTRCLRSLISAAICAAPRRAGTRVVVDNTFATPLLAASSPARRRHRRALGYKANRRALGSSPRGGGRPPMRASSHCFARPVAGTALRPGCSSASSRSAAPGRSPSGCGYAQAPRARSPCAWRATPPSPGCATRDSARSSASSCGMRPRPIVPAGRRGSSGTPRASAAGSRRRSSAALAHPGQEHIPPGLIRMSVGIRAARGRVGRPRQGAGSDLTLVGSRPMTTRWALTVPFAGIPLAEHPGLYRRAEAAGYDDFWTGGNRERDRWGSRRWRSRRR